MAKKHLPSPLSVMLASSYSICHSLFFLSRTVVTILLSENSQQRVPGASLWPYQLQLFSFHAKKLPLLSWWVMAYIPCTLCLISQVCISVVVSMQSVLTFLFDGLSTEIPIQNPMLLTTAQKTKLGEVDIFFPILFLFKMYLTESCSQMVSGHVDQQDLSKTTGRMDIDSCYANTAVSCLATKSGATKPQCCCHHS